jgi:hypothetical protein
MRIKSGWKVNICALETTVHHPEILSSCLYPWNVQTMIMTPTCHLRKLRDYLLDSELQHEANRSMAWVARCHPWSCPCRQTSGMDSAWRREKEKVREGIGTLSHARGCFIYDGNSWSGLVSFAANFKILCWYTEIQHYTIIRITSPGIYNDWHHASSDVAYWRQLFYLKNEKSRLSSQPTLVEDVQETRFSKVQQSILLFGSNVSRQRTSTDHADKICNLCELALIGHWL